jgi:hypothetical protein
MLWRLSLAANLDLGVGNDASGQIAAHSWPATSTSRADLCGCGHWPVILQSNYLARLEEPLAANNVDIGEQSNLKFHDF